MNTFQTLNDVNQGFEGLLPNSLNACQRSTLWIGNTQESPIATITIHETEANFILKVPILDIHLVKLELKVTPETILIQGQPTEAAGVEGYFLPSGFESLIPLPHPVQPETCSTEILSDGLTIKLAKQLRIQQSKVWIQLSTATANTVLSCPVQNS